MSSFHNQALFLRQREDAVKHAKKNIRRVFWNQLYKIRDISPWFHAPHHIFYVLSDLIGGLQTKEVEVSQQVVVEGKELEIQLGQSQTACDDEQMNTKGDRVNKTEWDKTEFVLLKWHKWHPCLNTNALEYVYVYQQIRVCTWGMNV